MDTNTTSESTVPFLQLPHLIAGIEFDQGRSETRLATSRLRKSESERDYLSETGFEKVQLQSETYKPGLICRTMLSPDLGVDVQDVLPAIFREISPRDSIPWSRQSIWF